MSAQRVQQKLRLGSSVVLALAGALVACAPEPQPKTLFDFMEDGLARDGVLTRCNRDRAATLDDEECSNARRAAATLALDAEHERAAALEIESQRKIGALRDRVGRETAAAAEAAGAAEAAAEAAYEAQWRNAPGLPPLGRHEMDAAPAVPPANDIEIAPPPVPPMEVAVIPRPFRSQN